MVSESPSSTEKLAMLQALDRWHDWRTLDDERTCVLCGREFTGRRIEVTKKRGALGAAHCPTPGCRGSLREFVFRGNPLTEEDSWNEWMRAFGDDDADPVH